MIFWLDAAFAIELIALVLAATLLYFLKAHNVKSKFSKFIAIFVIILAFLTMACTTYYGTKYWLQGYFEKPFSMKKSEMFKDYKKNLKNNQELRDSTNDNNNRYPRGSRY